MARIKLVPVPAGSRAWQGEILPLSGQLVIADSLHRPAVSLRLTTCDALSSAPFSFSFELEA